MLDYKWAFTSPTVFLSILLHTSSVGGVKVSIVAFQAIDPGSIPGRRTVFFSAGSYQWTNVSQH